MKDPITLPREDAIKRLRVLRDQARNGTAVSDPNEWQADELDAILAALSQEAEPVAWRYRTAPHRQWHLIEEQSAAGWEHADGNEVQRLIVHPSDRGGEVKG